METQISIADHPSLGETATAIPTGTVTFLFTDIEGSTRLLERLRQDYADLLAEQRQLLRAAFAEWNGFEVDTQGGVLLRRHSPLFRESLRVGTYRDGNPWGHYSDRRPAISYRLGMPRSFRAREIASFLLHAMPLSNCGNETHLTTQIRV